MKITKASQRRVVKMENYRGVCHKCQTPIEYDDELIVVEIERSESEALVVPVDVLVCPACGDVLRLVRIYFSLDVSREFTELKA